MLASGRVLLAKAAWVLFGYVILRMNSKFNAIFSAGLAALVAGCGPTITNLTSERAPENASGIYTLSMMVRNSDGGIPDQTFKPKIVIDGATHPMRASDLGRGVFEYEYIMPNGRNEARYYYILDYAREGGSGRTKTTDIYDLKLTNRYVLAMESLRGPVGARIPVVGRGFTEFDRVVVGGFEAETEFQSPSSLVFTVPPLAANQSYRAELIGGAGTQDLGEFHVDGSKLEVFPNPVELTAGERSTLGFGIQFAAPPNGQPISIMTDVPQSIVMPEVAIPPGARTVSVPIEGAKPGAGFLYISAPGFNEITVPVRISQGGGSSFNAPPPPPPQKQGEEILLDERDVEIKQGGDDMILGEADIIEL